MAEQDQKLLEILQKWYAEGQYQKVYDGCKKLLEVKPDFTEARELFFHVKEKLGINEQPPKLSDKHLENVDDTSYMIQNDYEEHDASSNRVMAISFAAVILIIGGFLIYQKNYSPDFSGGEKAAAPEFSEELTINEKLAKLPPEERTRAEANLQRVRDLQALYRAIDMYYATYKTYPPAREAAQKLLKEGIITKIPYDPKHNKANKKGELYGYIYAVFDTAEGKNQGAAISGLFENPDGDDRIQTFSSQQLPENYRPRDLKQPNIVLFDSYEKTNRK